MDDAQRTERQRLRLRIGEVTTTAPLDVALGGSDISYSGVSRLTPYTPTIGDRVAVLVRGNDLLVLGEIV